MLQVPCDKSVTVLAPLIEQGPEAENETVRPELAVAARLMLDSAAALERDTKVIVCAVLLISKVFVVDPAAYVPFEDAVTLAVIVQVPGLIPVITPLDMVQAPLGVPRTVKVTVSPDGAVAETLTVEFGASAFIVLGVITGVFDCCEAAAATVTGEDALDSALDPTPLVAMTFTV